MTRRLLALAALLWALGFAWFALLLPQPYGDEKTDGIVVLTGSAGRVDRGVALLRRGQAKQLLVSGVDQDVRPSEFAKAYGVPRKLMNCCVTLGREAIDTRSNAIETSRWLKRHGYKSVRIITADWHMRRGRYEIVRQLEDPVTVVADAVRSNPSLTMLLREYHKYLLRRAAGLVGI